LTDDTKRNKMLLTKDLKFQYSKDAAFSFPDIIVGSKERLLLLGSSGIGKTTLLHLLGGLMLPSSGEVIINGHDIKKFTGRDLDRFRGNNIGIVFQQNHFVEALNVIENIVLAQSLVGIKPDKEKAASLLERLSLKGKEYKKTNQLSQGEKQRVAIARSVINNPKLILADEPTSALDDNNGKEVFNLLQEQAHQEGAALVIVTHDNRLKSLITNQINLS
jgi:ABC-type lipoprotein export system ATPase subunit